MAFLHEKLQLLGGFCTAVIPMRFFWGQFSKKWRFFRWCFFSWDGELVGGWTNPFEKYARQIGSFPQVRLKIKNVWNHHLVFLEMVETSGTSNKKTLQSMSLIFFGAEERGVQLATQGQFQEKVQMLRTWVDFPPKIKLGSKVGIPVGVSCPNIYYISTIIGDDEITHFKQTHWWLKSWQEWFCVANWRFRLGSPILKSENPGGDYDKPRGTQPYLFPHSQFDRIWQGFRIKINLEDWNHSWTSGEFMLKVSWKTCAGLLY